MPKNGVRSLRLKTEVAEFLRAKAKKVAIGINDYSANVP